MQLIKYAITFIDANGEKQLLTKEARVAPIENSPFFNSEANAMKAYTRIAGIAAKLADIYQTALSLHIDEGRSMASDEGKSILLKHVNAGIIASGDFRIEPVTITI